MTTGYEVVHGTVANTETEPVQVDAPAGKFIVNTYRMFEEFGAEHRLWSDGPELVVDGSDRVTAARFFPASMDYEAFIICVDA